MIFGLIANLKRKGARKAIGAFVKWADESSNHLVLCEELKGITGNNLEFAKRDDIAAQVDIMVSMGGDGTLLAAARAVGLADIPILGINLGSLGFLTQLTPNQLVPALNNITAGNYQIQERMLLKTEIAGGKKLEYPYALNDVVVDNGGISRLIDIKLTVNGEHIVTYKADGLVMATPTGSTAYSLAVGGPIMHPEMQAIIAAPISSFSLSTRPMVFSGTDVIELGIRSEHGRAGLTLDGQVMEKLGDTDSVTITKADFMSRFIVFPENSFYQVLKSKLHWGIMPTAKG